MRARTWLSWRRHVNEISGRTSQRLVAHTALSGLVVVGMLVAAIAAGAVGRATPAYASPAHAAAPASRVVAPAHAAGHTDAAPAHPLASGTAASADASGSSSLTLQNTTALVQHNPTFYAIFWLPSGDHFDTNCFLVVVCDDSSYEATIEQYLGDAASTRLAQIVSQYYDYNGPILPSYNFNSIGDVWTDTSSYPNSVRPTSGALQYTDIQTEVKSALSANPNWHDGVNSTFLVFTAAGVASCDVNGDCTPGAPNFNKDTAICGFHGSTTDSNGNTIVYAHLPDAASLGENLISCNLNLPIINQSLTADNELPVLSHEQFEAMTDPIPNTGWYDSTAKLEIADECEVNKVPEVDKFRATLHANVHEYWLTKLWSNADGDCEGTVSPPLGYLTTNGPYVRTTGLSTGELNFAETAYVPNSPSIDWGDNTKSTPDIVAAVPLPTGCVNCYLEGSHTYTTSGIYKVTVSNWDCCTRYDTTLYIYVFDGQPSVTSISPSAVQSGGSSDVNLTVNGSGFDSSGGNSSICLNGLCQYTTYVPASGTTPAQLTATISHSMLASPGTMDVTVTNPRPSGTSAPQGIPAYLTSSPPQYLYVTATGVAVTQTQGASGTNPTASIPGLTASAVGTGALAVAQYASNPGATGLVGSTGFYFDVHVAKGNSFTSVTITDCNLNGGSQVLWYNTTTKTWSPASQQSYNAGTHCATVTVTSSTTPSLTQLAGLPFGSVNAPPVWQTTAAQSQDYHDPLSFTVKATDADPGESLALSVDPTTSLPAGLTFKDNGDGTATIAGTLTAAPNTYHVTFDASDGFNPAVPQQVTITVAHEQTSLTYTGDTGGTYGAPATLKATLQEDTSGPALPNEPVSLTLGSGAGAQSCGPTPVTNTTGLATCNLAALTLPAGSYTATAAFAGDANYAGTTASPTFTVAKQGATVTPAAADSMPFQVSMAGGTATVTLKATVAGTLAGGNIANAVPVVYTLTPVGPGTTYTCTDNTGSGVSGGVLNSSCTFSGVAVNVYELTVSLTSGYYSATPAHSVVTVYDPSLGFVTGGGTILHNGVPANFGFNAKYLKSGQIQGHVLYVEHRGTGDVVLVSNSMGALSIVPGSNGSAMYAYIQGKATFQGVGNYLFMVTAIDANGQAPSSNPDEFGLQVTDPTNAPPSGLTFPPVPLTGGNITVPHQ